MAARAKVPAPEKDRSERWLLTYSDMITLLLALFVILFATSKVDQVKFEQVAASLQKAFNVPVLQGASTTSLVQLGTLANSFAGLTGVGATIGPELISYAKQQELGDEISVTASKDAVVITLAGALVFSSGSAELRPEGQQALEFVAGMLRALPDQNPIRVEGHTDDVPPNSGQFPTNWELSAARAAHVARVLEEQGVQHDRLSAVGYADTRPIGDNATPDGRARNRRVEIWILNPQPAGPPAPAGQLAGQGAPLPAGLPTR